MIFTITIDELPLLKEKRFYGKFNDHYMWENTYVLYKTFENKYIIIHHFSCIHQNILYIFY